MADFLQKYNPHGNIRLRQPGSPTYYEWCAQIGRWAKAFIPAVQAVSTTRDDCISTYGWGILPGQQSVK
jgi:hypothetical protein